MISEVRLTGFLFNGCLVTNQPQSVLKMFLNFYAVLVIQVLPKNALTCKISKINKYSLILMICIVLLSLYMR